MTENNTDAKSTDDMGRLWASGLLIGTGFTLLLVGIVAANNTFDPIGTAIVGAAFLGFGWWVKRSADTDT